ncbi:group 1 glycosyl transferase [Spirochaetia bacterium]|nr:group 1 glycosyl transferase [Spirochaetia bacterium]
MKFFNKPKRVLINGDFLCRKITGIERYAWEITNRLDTLCDKDEIGIIVPHNAQVPPYKNLYILRHKKDLRSQLFWKMITLQFFLVTHRTWTILDFGNTCLPLAPGISFLHDIHCRIMPKDFITTREKLICLYSRFQYWLISKRAKKIVTVSYFSRDQIAKTYGIPPEKISVVYSSWNHFASVTADYSILDETPSLKTEFYFSLGTLIKRKNIAWILEYARKHKDTLFVLSGSPLSKIKTGGDIDSPPANIIYLGYLNDGQVKALMEKCKAFLLPSYYEGFGLTPLEALSCGAKIIVANAASLPEIYGNTAHYIDPFNTDVDLDALMQEPIEEPSSVLEKYSYGTSAKQVYDIIKNFTAGDWTTGGKAQ